MLSIAFVLAIVTSAIPKATLFAVFSGLAKGLSAEKLAPFISNMHVALWALAAVSLAGRVVCLLCGPQRPETPRAAPAPSARDPQGAARERARRPAGPRPAATPPAAGS